MKHIDSLTHVRGESLYLDDLPLREKTLHAAIFASPYAHGTIKFIDLDKALACTGVHAVITAQDIPGENQIGNILPDEPLLASGKVHYRGQPTALIVAETDELARAAREEIKLEIQPLPVVTDARQAAAKGLLIHAPRTFKNGNPDDYFDNFGRVFEGSTETGGQEHLYIETQGAYAFPTESGGVHVHSSTQGPTQVQRGISRVLGLPMHQVEVDVTRLGGGFGGKEDQATPIACLAALAAHITRRPVKLVLHRLDDMYMTGKRHPYSADYRIAVGRDYKIQAYEVTFYQNAGAAADLSPAVLERTLFHFTNAYYIPNCRATAYSCRTNLPPNTAFRGFGGPQGMFVIEAAIAHAARELGVTAECIQQNNIIKEGREFPYGQRALRCEARACWEDLRLRYSTRNLYDQVKKFNQKNKLKKKGLAVMPVCFGISFTKTMLNQASALVHIYTDGSVRISTGAVEMGQGVNTKMVQVVMRSLSLPAERIHIDTTNTSRIANSSPTAASAGADLNGKALEQACYRLTDRLLQLAANILKISRSDLSLRDQSVYAMKKKTDLTWDELISRAYEERLSLSAQAHYTTPQVHFSKDIEMGQPFAYHVYGAAAIEATVDCVRGTYVIDNVYVSHDYGKSMNPVIDLGQTEGGIVQGIGWMTMEEVIYDEKGILQSNALSTYKVPDIYATPGHIHVHFMDNNGHPLAIMKSKAIGEPPLMYGIGAYFAIYNAILAANPQADVPFHAPMTPERVLRGLYSNGFSLFKEKEKTTTTAGN
ncbi:MAG: molybdopterin-dependent oxidoreductase [Acidobacteriota bacterium]|nr:molybdopterin-dependent oxidoreductase [Acidobacteriota bacterium]